MSDLISKYDAIKAMFSDPPELHYPDWYMSIVEQVKTPWIPVSKMLPMKETWVLVTREWLDDYYVDCDMRLDNSWLKDGKMSDDKVIAWMEMPEPYKGGDSE